MLYSYKNFVTRKISYNKLSDMCDIIEAYGGGTVAVANIVGGEIPMSGVPVAPKTTVMTGDRRLIYYAERNKNLPFIIGDYPISGSGLPPVLVPTPPGGWYNWQNTLGGNRVGKFPVSGVYTPVEYFASGIPPHSGAEESGYSGITHMSGFSGVASGIIFEDVHGCRSYVYDGVYSYYKPHNILYKNPYYYMSMTTSITAAEKIVRFIRRPSDNNTGDDRYSGYAPGSGYDGWYHTAPVSGHSGHFVFVDDLLVKDQLYNGTRVDFIGSGYRNLGYEVRDFDDTGIILTDNYTYIPTLLWKSSTSKYQVHVCRVPHDLSGQTFTSGNTVMAYEADLITEPAAPSTAAWREVCGKPHWMTMMENPTYYSGVIDPPITSGWYQYPPVSGFSGSGTLLAESGYSGYSGKNSFILLPYVKCCNNRNTDMNNACQRDKTMAVVRIEAHDYDGASMQKIDEFYPLNGDLIRIFNTTYSNEVEQQLICDPTLTIIQASPNSVLIMPGNVRLRMRWRNLSNSNVEFGEDYLDHHLDQYHSYIPVDLDYKGYTGSYTGTDLSDFMRVPYLHAPGAVQKRKMSSSETPWPYASGAHSGYSGIEVLYPPGLYEIKQRTYNTDHANLIDEPKLVMTPHLFRGCYLSSWNIPGFTPSTSGWGIPWQGWEKKPSGYVDMVGQSGWEDSHDYEAAGTSIWRDGEGWFTSEWCKTDCNWQIPSNVEVFNLLIADHLNSTVFLQRHKFNMEKITTVDNHFGTSYIGDTKPGWLGYSGRTHDIPVRGQGWSGYMIKQQIPQITAAYSYMEAINMKESASSDAASGYSGQIGFSGWESGYWLSGYPSGISGYIGYSGHSGVSGYSWQSGWSWFSGYSDTTTMPITAWSKQVESPFGSFSENCQYIQEEMILMPSYTYKKTYCSWEQMTIPNDANSAWMNAEYLNVHFEPVIYDMFTDRETARGDEYDFRIAGMKTWQMNITVNMFKFRYQETIDLNNFFSSAYIDYVNNYLVVAPEKAVYEVAPSGYSGFEHDYIKQRNAATWDTPFLYEIGIAGDIQAHANVTVRDIRVGAQDDTTYSGYERDYQKITSTIDTNSGIALTSGFYTSGVLDYGHYGFSGTGKFKTYNIADGILAGQLDTGLPVSGWKKFPFVACGQYLFFMEAYNLINSSTGIPYKGHMYDMKNKQWVFQNLVLTGSNNNGITLNNYNLISAEGGIFGFTQYGGMFSIL